MNSSREACEGKREEGSMEALSEGMAEKEQKEKVKRAEREEEGEHLKK